MASKEDENGKIPKSKKKDNKIELNKLFSTAFVFTLFGTVLSFLILFFGSEILSILIFGREESYTYVFKILAFILPFMGVNAVLYSLLNGLSSKERIRPSIIFLFLLI